MPQIDKPLEELKCYRGRNPRPVDFEAYWETALAELGATEAAVTLERSATLTAAGVDCFDLWFTGAGGARVYAKYLRPAGRVNCPILLKFHGYTGDSGDWVDNLSYVGQGFVVAAMDCRGQGGRSEDPGGVKGTTLHGHIVRGLDDPDPHKLYYRSVFLDTVQLARVVASFPETDEQRMMTTGGSQGGALSLACAALEPRIQRVACAFPFLSDYLRVWEMDLAEKAYEGLRQFFRRHDPRHERAAELFTRLGYIDLQHLAPRIEASVLFVTGLMDDMCPPSSQFAVYNRLPGKKEMIVYPDYEHEKIPDQGDRFFNFLTGA